MKSKRFSIGKVFLALLLSFKARILLAVTGVITGFMFSYQPQIEAFNASKAIAWSIPFGLLGMFIGFLIDSALNRTDSARNKQGNSFQPEPTDGSGHAD